MERRQQRSRPCNKLYRVAYFEDLSEYVYLQAGRRKGTFNVGWLGIEHAFPLGVAGGELLELIWECSKISVVQTRGIHRCELCKPAKTVRATRNGEPMILLGSAEIRVFSEDGRIYAAPTLIYHYIRTHQYKPPDEFLDALRLQPKPRTQGYLDLLQRHRLKWNETPAKSGTEGYRVEHVEGRIRRVPVEMPTFIDEG